MNKPACCATPADNVVSAAFYAHTTVCPLGTVCRLGTQACKPRPV